MVKKECIAMLLAGGQGSRLGILTKNIAKPAVPYGGKYRIIDFPLSNCVNSGIDTVGVLTQYRPLELNDYIGNGQPWDLDRMNGGVHILSPYQQMEGSQWYKGTANAIYQNIQFIDRYAPEYVLILSGDHIYKMDYSRMLDYHKDKKADCTIAMLEVPWDEASRFGLMLVREDGSIAEFEEKPKEPRSNKASMGVYVFTWKVLREYLLLDEADAASSNDFGKDLIPRMHSDGRGLFAFPFDGYWKDVGTIESLWDANLDILNPKIDLDLSDENWKIYSNSPASPPHYLAVGARVQNSIIAEGCTVEGSLDYSVLFANVSVGKGAEVKYSIVMPGTVIEEGACVQYAIVAENTRIGARAVVGECPEDVSNRDDWGVAVVGSGLSIGAGSVVKAKTMVENDIAEGTK
ncbi:MAG TPA: glucose-1-phosphate adenylyltransferase [Clostridiales bacterium]|nr:MAG: Glucose-1-phosphate adenylyltransferase [Firmicutes bacterium ADurb.Bin262]HOU10302.1 glucose-1-phosphate adenylyltransferase [Clostridiales bacterium]HQH62455.1 glucose-1-phosphate adenylyltransferase [Clostridiales bacterium]HQK74465.1 glucose-1-phosphate adenylyltransferase [Clostridiales bacterium]